MDAATAYKLMVRNTATELECRIDQTVLEAAIAAGLDFPYACATGNCGACVCRLESGEVILLPRSDASLSPEQVAAGQTLACRAQPRSDVAVTWLGRGRR